MKPSDVHTPPPIEQDHSNISIHLSYIRRDLDALTQNQSKNAETTRQLLEDIRNGTPSRKEFEELRGHIDTKAGVSELTIVQKQIEKLVTKDDFEPIKKLAYGMVAMTLIAVFSAILVIVIKG